ncbi:MAG: phage major capsid protein [Caulobacter sp.]|nr:phage major capsid protein [Caulobacter sp.]
MNIKDLRQQRSTKATRGKAALGEYNTLSAKADRTEEEETKLAALATELDELEAACAALDTQIEKEEAAQRRGAVFASGARQAGSAARTMNEPNPATTGGFRNLAEFAVATRNALTGAGTDPRLAQVAQLELGAAPTGYHENQGSAGEGFLVPLDYRQQIWEIAFSPTDLLGMVNPEPTNSNSVKIGKDESTPWGAAGVQAAWRSEGQQMVASKASQTQMTVDLHELYAFVLATDEVLSDAPRLQDRLTRQAGRAIAWKASDAILWGDGVGKPLGFMNAASKITVAKESGQAAATLTVPNILKMGSRLLRMGGRPMWMGNSDIMPQLEALTLGNVPAFLPMNEPLKAAGYEGTLRGKPLLYTEHSHTLGTEGDLSLLDLDGYYCANKTGGIDFASSIHLFFDYGIQAFRWTFRFGGQPWLSAPVNPARGSTTKSHFVTLADRG